MPLRREPIESSQTCATKDLFFLLPPKGMKPEAQGGPLLGAHDPPIHLGVNQVVERCTQQGWVYLYQPAAGPL